jgi:acetyl-CoA C-acetyltransferase
MTVDARTPVIVGVGQAAERIDDPEYRAMSPVELAAAAAQAALDDSGGAAVAAAVDTVAGVPGSSRSPGSSTRRWAGRTTTRDRSPIASVPSRPARSWRSSAARDLSA